MSARELAVQMQRRKGGLRARTDMADPTTLRMPVVLRDHLEACAKANFRSLSAEMCARLEASTVGESIDEHGAIVRAAHRSSK
ncbi:Arc family DNA-binding protein [Acidovorax sp. sif1233]|uniref:Arc family DNA-binding protein n=1 Tax=Acidovorax sp. sif1233 TaxID=2854792 RepID=UPI001C489963|nr:Arc family DNA-binding protein [Acidovorax sp. sif1233]MBV7454318.1 Arc family DNA-binding protein [Acidovorax sp. sif1233]